MSERTIADILGWTYREVEIEEHDVVSIVVLPFGPDGERLIRTQGPTVDDLVEWLMDQDRMVWFAPRRKGLVAQVRVGPPHSQSRPLFSQAYHGPTLLAALEAAVRAVDSEATGTS